MIVKSWFVAVGLLHSITILILAVLLAVTALLIDSGTLHGRGSIAFVSERDGGPQIYLMDTDRGLLRQLTDAPAIHRRPVWSPDGRQIAFYANREGSWDIYLMTAGGLRQRPALQSPAREGNLTWSPDGEWVAFDSTRDGNLEIYVMSARCLDAPDGCEAQRLTRHAAADRYPVWSPDSRHILFESSRFEYYEIFRMDPDGDNLIRLTTNTIPDWGAAWSTDGRQIAFTSSRADHWGLYVIDADCYTQPQGCEASIRPLVEHPHDSALPDWSPDGRYIVFESWIEDNWELFVLDTADHSLERLTHNTYNDNAAVWWP